MLDNIALDEKSSQALYSKEKPSWRQKATTLFLKEGLCVGATFTGSLFGLPFLQHNIALEFGLIISTAVASEAIGHKIFECTKEKESKLAVMKRYGISLAFGLATWPIHHAIFHTHDDGNHDHHHEHEHHDHHHTQLSTVSEYRL